MVRAATILSVTIVLAVLLAPSASAVEIAKNAGTRGADFLRIEAGARHAALGGTYAAYGTSVFTLFGQPAAIAERTGYEVGLQHNEWVQGISQQYGGFQMPLGSGRVAMTASLLGASGIQRTTDDAFGRFGVSSGTFGVNDYALALHYARIFGGTTAAGAAVRYIRSEMDDVSANGVAIDLGLRRRINPGLTLGASVTNLGQGLKFLRDRSDLPVTGRVGAAYELGRLLFVTDLTYTGSDDLEGMFGAEWKPVEMVALRAGYKTQTRSDLGEGLTAGIGLTVDAITLDYAYVPFGPLGETHRISGSYSF